MTPVQRMRFVDSHTAGEPTRVILDGFPTLPGETLAGQRAALTRDFDAWRNRVNNEPRGNDVLVSALLVEPKTAGCAAGVIFFNNVGPLGMCGHGTIGLVATLAYLGRIQAGEHRIETPVGTVTATLHPDGQVSVANVAAYRHLADVAVTVPGIGEVRGDVAWGGNWFFLVSGHGLELEMAHLEELTDYAWRVRQALAAQGVTGTDGAEIDHVELFAPSPTANSRNFVLCPGKAYDRSPCGTGTSAKLACLAEDGKLAPGEAWVQESIIGSRFEGHYDLLNGEVRPTITGRAFVMAEGELVFQDGDPFAWGIGSPSLATQGV